MDIRLDEQLGDVVEALENVFWALKREGGATIQDRRDARQVVRSLRALVRRARGLNKRPRALLLERIRDLQHAAEHS